MTFALDGVGNHRLRGTTGLIKLFPHQDAMPKSTLNGAVSWLTFSVSTGVLGKRKLDDDDDDVFGFFTAGVSTHGSTNRGEHSDATLVAHTALRDGWGSDGRDLGG